MGNKFCKKELWECSADLASVAMGRKPAETVIKNAKLINVCTAEIIEHTDVAIYSGRIALVGDAFHSIGEGTKIIDAEGEYIAPGFLDGHIHVESSMLSFGEYAKAVVPHGTTGIYYDPHEICNVIGLDGVNLMVEDAERTPLKGFLTTPSCVPAVPGFEDSGSEITSKDIESEMKRNNVVGLGEMMNFPGIINSVEETHAITGNTLKAGKVVTGHFSIPETGRALNAFVSSGIRCCHESTRAEDALAKMRLGMYAQFREGSAWHDLPVVCRAILDNKIDTRYACMISDDTHPFTLMDKGHMDHVLRVAVESGIDPITAIQMCTLNTASCYRMDHEIGSISPSKCADIVFMDDLDSFHVTRVMIDGEVVAENGKILCKFAPYTYPERAMHSMHVGEKITAETFKIHTEKTGKIKIRAIEIIPLHVGNREIIAEMEVKDGCLESDTDRDILKTFVFERHHNTGKHGFGFVKGFDIKFGAMASTVAHDAHNLLVIGTNDEDMSLAANTLIECGGGLCAVQNGKLLAVVELPIAGLMSSKQNSEVSADVEKLTRAWETIGCDIPSPFMTMSLIALACLPDLRLTDRGLVDCNRFCFVPVEAEEDE